MGYDINGVMDEGRLEHIAQVLSSWAASSEYRYEIKEAIDDLNWLVELLFASDFTQRRGELKKSVEGTIEELYRDLAEFDDAISAGGDLIEFLRFWPEDDNEEETE